MRNQSSDDVDVKLSINLEATQSFRSNEEKDIMINKYLLKAQEKYSSMDESKSILNETDDVLGKLKIFSVDNTNDVLIPPEIDWLDNHPSSSQYNEIRQRINLARDHANELQMEYNTAHQYFENEFTKTMLLQNSIFNHHSQERDRVITKICFELLDEVLSVSIPAVCHELFASAQSSLDVLNRSLIKALTHFSDNNKRFLKMSGRIDVIKGALTDVQSGGGINNSSLAGTNHKLNVHNSNKKVSLSQRLYVPPSKIVAASEVNSETPQTRRWRPLTHSTLSLIPDGHCHDTTQASQLHYHSEMSHVNGITLHACVDMPLQLPTGNSGQVTIMRSFLHFSPKHTVLLVGTSRGKVFLYLIPWDGSQPTLHAMTYPNNSSNQTHSKHVDASDTSEIVEITVSQQGVMSFMTLSAAGTISFYSLNPNIDVSEPNGIRKQLPSSTLSRVYEYFFGGKRKKGNKIMPLNCIYRLNKYDLTLSLPIVKSPPDPFSNTHNTDTFSSGNGSTGLSTLGALLQNNSIQLENSVFPVTVCYHPSLTMLGGWTSIMVGTSGGDLVKFNLDYQIKCMNGPIMYPFNSHVKPLLSSMVQPTAAVPKAVTNVVQRNKTSPRGNHSHSKSPSASNSRNTSPRGGNIMSHAVSRGADSDSGLYSSRDTGANTTRQSTSVNRFATVQKSPLPFVNKEYIHNHDAPLGFVLTNGNSANKGNKVFRELFHYHKARILLIEVIDCLSDTLISLDAEGFLAVWQYSSDYFSGKFWFVPKTSIKLDLSVKQYDTSSEVTKRSSVPTPTLLNDPKSTQNADNTTQYGEVVQLNSDGSSHIVPHLDMSHLSPPHQLELEPTEDEMLQLQCRSRTVHPKTGVITELFYPVYSASEEKMVQYRKTITPAATKQTKSSARNNVVKHNVLHSKSTLDVKEPDRESNSHEVTKDKVPELKEAVAESKEVSSMESQAQVKGEEKSAVEKDVSSPMMQNEVDSKSIVQKREEGEPQSSVESEVLTLQTSVPNGEVLTNVIPSVELQQHQQSAAELDPLHHHQQQQKHSTVETIKWSYSKVKERDKHLSIVSTRFTADGSDLVLLLSCHNSKSSGAKQTQDKSAAKPDIKGDTITYYIVTLHTVSMKFHTLFPTLTIDASVDSMLDFCVGPLMKETLTRLCFVLTRKHGVRLFSLETGMECHNKSFPFMSSLPSHQPTKITVCPSQRVLTLYSAEDARIAVYVIKHSLDGTTSVHAADDIPVLSSDTDDLLRTKAYLQSRAIATIQDITIVSSTTMSKSQVDVVSILDDIVDRVFAQLEQKISNQYKSDLIASLYGSSTGLGFIAPTEWPVPIPLPKFASEWPSLGVEAVQSAEPSRSSKQNTGSVNEQQNGDAVSDDFILSVVVTVLEGIIDTLIKTSEEEKQEATAVNSVIEEQLDMIIDHVIGQAASSLDLSPLSADNKVNAGTEVADLPVEILNATEVHDNGEVIDNNNSDVGNDLKGKDSSSGVVDHSELPQTPHQLTSSEIIPLVDGVDGGPLSQQSNDKLSPLAVEVTAAPVESEPEVALTVPIESSTVVAPKVMSEAEMEEWARSMLEH